MTLELAVLAFAAAAFAAAFAPKAVAPAFKSVLRNELVGDEPEPLLSFVKLFGSDENMSDGKVVNPASTGFSFR